MLLDIKLKKRLYQKSDKKKTYSFIFNDIVIAHVVFYEEWVKPKKPLKGFSNVRTSYTKVYDVLWQKQNLKILFPQSTIVDTMINQYRKVSRDYSASNWLSHILYINFKKDINEIEKNKIVLESL